MGLSFEQIKAAYEQEAANASKVYSREEIPMSWDLITPEWLTDILIGAGKPEQVTAYRLDTKDEGTASRRRIFLEYNEAGRAAGLPATVFGKSTQHLENRFIIGMNGGIEAEVTFFQAVRPKLDIEAPVCLHARFNPNSLNSIVIMRDIAGEVEFGFGTRTAEGAGKDLHWGLSARCRTLRPRRSDGHGRNGQGRRDARCRGAGRWPEDAPEARPPPGST